MNKVLLVMWRRRLLWLKLSAVLLVLYTGSYLIVRTYDYRRWQQLREKWDVPAIVYHDADWHYTLLYPPLMRLDAALTDIRFMYIPDHELK